jgi:quaternary ammonium compound-resistance protein SugE
MKSDEPRAGEQVSEEQSHLLTCNRQSTIDNRQSRSRIHLMPWLYLIAAGICEIVWAIGLKLYGFRLSWGSAVTVLVMLLSFWLLQLSMRSLPLSSSYAIWTGIGAVGTALYGLIVLREARSAGQIACIALVIAGIVGLKLLTPAQ